MTASEPTMHFAAVCAGCGALVLETDGWFERVERLEQHLRDCPAAAIAPPGGESTLGRFAIVARRRQD